MKYLAIAAFILTYSLPGSSQVTGPKNPCDTLKNLKYLNGPTDTLVIKAKYWAITRLPGYDALLSQLDKKHNLKFYSQIGFRIENCDRLYYAPMANFSDIKDILNTRNIGSIIYVTCIAFKGYLAEDDGTPYFVVINVSSKWPQKLK